MKRIRKLVRYFAENIAIALGIILIWRGIWHLLDLLDAWLFGGSSYLSATVSIIAGLLILYLPDHDLKELGKL